MTEKLRFLEARGFARREDLDTASPTLKTFVYQGRHVAIIVSYDERDQLLDADVARVENGRIRPRAEGGFSSGLYPHLVRHHAYRGPGLSAPNEGGTLEAEIDSLAKLLTGPGAPLIADREDSLPR